MIERYLRYVFAFVGLILVANLLILDFYFVKQRTELLDFQTKLTEVENSLGLISSRMFASFPDQPPAASPSAAKSSNNSGSVAANSILAQLGALDACPQTCMSLINASTISAVVAPVTNSPIIRAPTSQLVSPTGSNQFLTKGEYFIPLGSGTLNQASDWTTLESAQATFDYGNFPGLKTAYFEVFIRMPRTNGTVHARLIDTTSGLPFSETEVETTSLTTQYSSIPISLTTGKRTYKVQMYNSLDQSVLDQARIRIVSQ